MHMHKTGPYDPVVMAVVLSSGVPVRTISNGDLISFVAASGQALPASAFPWTTDLVTTQPLFVALFAGVAETKSGIGSVDPRSLSIEVCADGTFMVDMLAATTLVVGQYLGPAKNPASNNLVNQLAVVAARTSAVAVVVENTVGASLTVKARLINTITKK